MKPITTLVLTLAWICLSSFVINPINTKKIPTHNSPIVSVSISEKPDQTLQVQIRAEKIFLKSKGLTDKQFKPLLIPLKNYFKEHLNIDINDNQQILRLKSISENKLRVNLTYQIKNIKEVKKMKVFSDCLTEMEEHDRMPIHVNIGIVNKKYRISNKRTSVKIQF
jgi:hypothetical protein